MTGPALPVGKILTGGGDIVITAATILSICLMSQIDEPTAKNLRPEVSQLIKALEADEPDDRDAAENRLISIGVPVLELLPQTNDNSPTELHARIERIRKALQLEAAKEILAPSRLTLEGTFDIPEILAQIKEQTGNQVVDFRERFGQPQTNVELQLEIKDEPFWRAFDKILDQAGLTIYNYVGQTRTLGVVAKDSGERDREDAAAYSGLFRVEAAEIMSQRNLRNPTNQSLRLRFELLWEPRVIPILVQQAMSDLEILGDDGQAIEVAAPEGTIQLPVQSTVAGLDLVVPLKLPDRSTQSIKQLNGQFTALIPGREETFEFEELESARNVTREVDGLTVTLDQVRKNGSLFEVRIRLKIANAGKAFQSHLDWASNNEVYLEGPDGQRIDNPNFERYFESEEEIGFAYLFPIDEEEITGYRLVYKSPVAIVDVPFDFELTEIELP